MNDFFFKYKRNHYDTSIKKTKKYLNKVCI